MVDRSIYPEFLSRFTAAVRELRVGPAVIDGQEQHVDIGPLMHQAAFDVTAERVADALELGAHRLAGGEAHALGGLFYQPTVLADVTPQMRIYREENFAPIAGVMPFDSIEHAIEMANDTEYGLAAYLCSNRLDLIYPLIRRLNHAMIAVNGVKFTGHPIPFGGMKASGLGREGGARGLRSLCRNQILLPASPRPIPRRATHEPSTRKPVRTRPCALHAPVHPRP